MLANPRNRYGRFWGLGGILCVTLSLSVSLWPGVTAPSRAVYLEYLAFLFFLLGLFGIGVAIVTFSSGWLRTRRAGKLIWLAAQAAIACWFVLSTAVDRQFLFYFVLALSFPAGLLVYVMSAVGGIAIEEHFHLGLWGLLNALTWAVVVAAGYWQWFVFIPRHVLPRV